MEMCFSCFMNTKYKCLQKHGQAYIPLGAIAVVSDTLFLELYVMRVFSFYFSPKELKARRALYFGISLASPSSKLAAHRVNSTGTRAYFRVFNEVQLVN